MSRASALHQINRHRGSRGSIWQDERYDRIVRDEAEFLEKWQYIMNNPVKKELVKVRKITPGSISRMIQKTHRRDACATNNIET